ncbi:origin recognition complex subunit 1-like isoform X2 [Rhodnius prolixus]|uniref:origin recognition complex subunit 1-like isoform X2 n=1 Tax=Rhodnius prolixus TaxID=13249 RepID=UPI003D1898B9
MPQGKNVQSVSNEGTGHSLIEFLNRRSVTPPALSLHLQNNSEAKEKTPLRHRRLLQEDGLTDNSSPEWMILPKKSPSHKKLLESNSKKNVSSITDAESSVTDNCLVSPILLKKKSTNNVRDKFKKQTDGSMKMLVDEHLESEFSSLDVKKCQVVLSRVQLLDELATDDRSNCLNIDKNTIVLRSRKTPKNSVPYANDSPRSSDLPAKGIKLKSARKRLDLTPSSKREVLTPTFLEARERVLTTNPTSMLDQARISLQILTTSGSLPCRNAEYDNIRTYVLRKILDGSGGCMYISGVPGTGKTATVHAVVKSLQQDSQHKKIPSFDFVEVNGLRLTEPRQSYVRIWQALTGNKVIMELALKNLEKKFLGRPTRTTLLLLDELDYLCNKRQDVIYNLLEWTTKHHSRLVILTIANTMDLPERTLKGKITSRMGLTRLVFQPYTYQQLQEIVMNRLGKNEKFHADAVQLVARKVAAVSGDARRALDICRRAIETFDSDSDKPISVFDIEKVISNIFTGVRVQAIKNCSNMCKLILRAIKDEVLRVGVEETTLGALLNQLDTICSLEGILVPNPGEVATLCNVLADSGLIVAEWEHRTDLKRKLSLNVSPDDIHYALNC